MTRQILAWPSAQWMDRGEIYFRFPYFCTGSTLCCVQILPGQRGHQLHAAVLLQAVHLRGVSERAGQRVGAPVRGAGAQRQDVQQPLSRL